MVTDDNSVDEETDGPLDGFDEWIEETQEWRHETDRTRGILTRGDREYLKGEKILEGQAKRNANHRIKNRLNSALRDIVLLTDTDELHRFGQIIKDMDHPRQKGLTTTASVKFGMEAAMAFSDVDPFGRGKTKEEELEDLLESAISYVIQRNPDNRLPETVSVSLELDAVDLDSDEVIDELLNGKPTSQEVTELLRMADHDELEQRMVEEGVTIDIYSADPAHSDEMMYSISAENLEERSGSEE